MKTSISYAPYRIYNIGNNNSVQLLDFIHTLEDCLGKKAIISMLPMQKGDVKATFANVDALNNETGITKLFLKSLSPRRFSSVVCLTPAEDPSPQRASRQMMF